MPLPRPGTEIEVRHPAWAADEAIYLRPRRTFKMSVRAQGKALIIPPGVDVQKLTEDELGAYIDQGIAASELMREMIVRSTVRYMPTPEQEAAGQSGDTIPLGDELFDALSDDEGALIAEKIQALGESHLQNAPGGPVPEATFQGGSGSADPGQLPAPGEPVGEAGGLGSGVG